MLESSTQTYRVAKYTCLKFSCRVVNRFCRYITGKVQLKFSVPIQNLVQNLNVHLFILFSSVRLEYGNKENLHKNKQSYEVGLEN